MLTKSDYQSALDIQSAVNLPGTAHEFAEIMRLVCIEANETGRGDEWINHHPICRLYAEAICRLSGAGGTSLASPWKPISSWSDAHNVCTRAVAGHHDHLVITLTTGQVLEYAVRSSAPSDA